VEREGKLVGSDLGGGVWGLPLERMILGDWHKSSRSIDFAGGCVDYSFNSEFPSGLENIECAFDVGIHIGVGRVVGVGNTDECSQVEDRLASSHSLFNSVRVANIARKNFELPLNLERTVIEPTPGVEGVVENEGAHFVTGPDESLCEVRSNESVGAGDKEFMAHK
jgi:hypothetical protein